jgi:lipoprotein NlpD
MNRLRIRIFTLLPLLLAACSSQQPAPVLERDNASTGKPVVPVASSLESKPGYHTVKKGDTLYGIALDNGQDYRDLVSWNSLENPNLIKIGQQLRVQPEGGAPVAVAKPVTSSAPVEIKPDSTTTAAKVSAVDAVRHDPKGGKVAYSDEALARARQAESTTKISDARQDVKPVEAKPEAKPAPAPDDVDWAWPSKGKLQAAFAEGSSKGIDIGGKSGDPVLAAGNGSVSYAGSGLRGYGNLVVVRHNATYLSVYAHNSKILVKEKQAITKGMKIAEIGSSDADSPRLHFEIRKLGKPVDPQKFLPAL